MKTISTYLADQLIDEKAETRKWASRSKHGWKRGGTPRVFPGQPTREVFSVGIAAAPNQLAEYISIYETRNHLRSTAS